MLGAIVGDIVGSRFEHGKHKGRDFFLFTKQSTFTDDTVLTLAIGEALVEYGDFMDQQFNTTDETGSYLPSNGKALTTVNDEAGAAGHDGQMVKGQGPAESSKGHDGQTAKVDAWDVIDVDEDLLSDMAREKIREYGLSYPDAGYGHRFKAWLKETSDAKNDSFGNGAPMRVSPVAYVARSLDMVKTLSRAVTAVSHNHPEGIRGAEAIAVATYMALHGSSKEEIHKAMTAYYDLTMTVDGLIDTYRFDATCQGSVPQALVCFFESTDFESAIRNAVAIGGDTDTLAAMAGSIGGAFYGIPAYLAEEAQKRLTPHLKASLLDFETAFYVPPVQEGY